jgi:hypothetical protein
MHGVPLTDGQIQGSRQTLPTDFVEHVDAGHVLSAISRSQNGNEYGSARGGARGAGTVVCGGSSSAQQQHEPQHGQLTGQTVSDLLPSMVSISSSTVASQRKLMSAHGVRYSRHTALIKSSSNLVSLHDREILIPPFSFTRNIISAGFLFSLRVSQAAEVAASHEAPAHGAA